MMEKSHYHTLITTIVNQQLSVKAGKNINERLLALRGRSRFNAVKMEGMTSQALRACGVTQRKLQYIRAVTSKELRFASSARQDDEPAVQTLIQYTGNGCWSAEMFLNQWLARQDVYPLGDLVLRKSLQYHQDLPGDSTEPDYHRVADAWWPYRTLVSRILWSASPRPLSAKRASSIT